jgi:hypothetical protein
MLTIATPIRSNNWKVTPDLMCVIQDGMYSDELLPLLS